MNLNNLEAFYFVAKFGGYSRASRAFPYPIGEPALHKRVKALERDLTESVGSPVHLFEREKKSVFLSAAGKQLFEEVAALFEKLHSIKHIFQDDANPHFRIAMAKNILLYVIPPAIKRFESRFPDVRLTILERSELEVIPMLQKGEVDMALGFFRLRSGEPHGVPDIFTKGSREFMYTAIPHTEIVLITPRSFPLAKKKVITLQDITEYPMITYEVGSMPWKNIRVPFKEQGLQFYVIIETSNTEAIKRLVCVGKGIAIVPFREVMDIDPKMVKVFSLKHFYQRSPSPDGVLPYYVIRLKAKKLSDMEAEFIRLLKEDGQLNLRLQQKLLHEAYL